MDVKFGGVRGRGEVSIGFWKGGLKERDHLEDLVVNGRIILEMGWEDLDWMDLDLESGQFAGSYAWNSYPSFSVKCGEFLFYLRTC